ncbi:hypothetical protein PG984_009938 [Apiospora sp. TS-2023a]
MLLSPRLVYRRSTERQSLSSPPYFYIPPGRGLDNSKLHHQPPPRIARYLAIGLALRFRKLGPDLEDAVDGVLKNVNETKPDFQPTGAPTASVPTTTSNNTLVAQKHLGINRKRKRGQQQNGPAKRARSANTSCATGSPASQLRLHRSPKH